MLLALPLKNKEEKVNSLHCIIIFENYLEKHPCACRVAFL